VTFWTLLGLMTGKSNGWRNCKATLTIRCVKLTRLHAAKVQGEGGEEVSPHSFTTSVRRRRGVNVTPRPLYPRKIIIGNIYYGDQNGEHAMDNGIAQAYKMFIQNPLNKDN
jgi:hypothetical protein